MNAPISTRGGDNSGVGGETSCNFGSVLGASTGLEGDADSATRLGFASTFSDSTSVLNNWMALGGETNCSDIGRAPGNAEGVGGVDTLTITGGDDTNSVGPGGE